LCDDRGVIFARTAEEWRAWLEEHHETESEVWLHYWKKSSGKRSIDWARAVEVALQYGWIDGLVRGIDAEQYMQRFTPRRPNSKWSKVNKEIALRLIAAGEMSPMGLRAVEAAKASGEWDRAYTAQRPLRAPDDLREAIKQNPEAKRHRDRISTTRWNRWVEWLEGTEGRTRTRRINMVMRALATRDYTAIEKQCPATKVSDTT
jgi:uncharacterized protein YdeI (YjbR/CyaY-like superfamily)